MENEREQALRSGIADFARQVLLPKSGHIDQTGFDRQHYQKLMDAGFVGAAAPSHLGGGGVGTVGRCIIIEEIAYACPSTALTYMVGGMGLYPQVATAEQLERYYAPWVAGKILPAFALTEPQAGTDVAAVALTALRDGDDYVLNGTKTFVTNGKSGDIVHVYAVTDPTVPASKGLSVFAVEQGTPGMAVHCAHELMGCRGAEVVELTFTDCRIPKSQLLGQEGKGFGYAMGGIDAGRINVAAKSIGIGRRALDEAVTYAKSRTQFGKPIAAQQGIGWYLAEMKCAIEGAAALTYEAARRLDSGDKEGGIFASMAKYQATEAAQFCAQHNLQIHGGLGCTTADVAEKIYRDAHLGRIYDGTSEVLKLVVARHLIGR